MCCIMPDEWNYECRCNVGWVCDREKVTAGFCGSSKCFSNCKITNWALGAIIAAAGVLIIIFALVIILFCRKKKDDDDDIY